MGKLRGRGWGGLSCADPVNMYVDIITLSTSSVKMDILWEAVHCKTQSFLSYCNRILLLAVKVRSVSLEGSNFTNRGQTGRRVIFFNPPSPHQQKKQIRLYDSTTSPRSEINHPSLPVCELQRGAESRNDAIENNTFSFPHQTYTCHM